MANKKTKERPSQQVEYRTFKLDEARADEGEGIIEGHAAVWDTETDIGPFREVIRRGAFAESIETDDIRMLWNHNTDIPLARTANNTLVLQEDDIGLANVAELNPEDPDAQRALAKIGRGDVDQMSFMFRAQEDHWVRGQDGEKDLRELRKVKLYEVSPVTFPAYPETDVGARSVLRQAGLDYDGLARAVVRAKHHLELTAFDRKILHDSINFLSELDSAEPGSLDHTPQRRLGALRRQLEMVERSI